MHEELKNMYTVYMYYLRVMQTIHVLINLHGNCTAEQCLCFRYTDSIIPLLPKSDILSFWPFSVASQAGLCQTLSETLKTIFLCHGSYEKSLLKKVRIFGERIP